MEGNARGTVSGSGAQDSPSSDGYSGMWEAVHLDKEKPLLRRKHQKNQAGPTSGRVWRSGKSGRECWLFFFFPLFPTHQYFPKHKCAATKHS